MNFFSHIPTVNDVKREYRRLAMQHHPDRGGDVETMKTVNVQYFSRLAQLNGQTSEGFDGKEHTYRYEPEVERQAADIVSKLLALDLPGCDVILIGTWVWVEGDTRPVRSQIKSVEGMRWHSKRVMWYWSPERKKRRHYSKMSTPEMKDVYGVKYFEKEEKARTNSGGSIAA